MMNKLEYVFFPWRLLERKKTDIPYATFNTRVIASIVDIGLIMLVLSPVFQLTNPLFMRGVYEGQFEGQQIKVQTFSELIALITALHAWDNLAVQNIFQITLAGILIVLCWVKWQATPGKMLLRLRIVDAVTYGKPARAQFVRRYLGYLVSGAVFFMGFITMTFDKRTQGWHDKIAGTVVLQDKWTWPFKKKSTPVDETDPAAHQERHQDGGNAI